MELEISLVPFDAKFLPGKRFVCICVFGGVHACSDMFL